MSEQAVPDRVRKADRLSKPIALVVAIVVFLLANRLTSDVQFASIIAALAGIGARLYVPYHANVQLPDDERLDLRDHRATGNYHYGAAGVALCVIAAVSLGAFLYGHGFITAVGIGVIGGVVGYVVSSSVLPAS